MTIKKMVNLTPHDIFLNDGSVVKASGVVARVKASFTGFDENLVCKQEFGPVENLPEKEEGTLYVVSALVLAASDREDLVAPATGHPACIRDEKGMIASVPGFVSKG